MFVITGISGYNETSHFGGLLDIFHSNFGWAEEYQLLQRGFRFKVVRNFGVILHSHFKAKQLKFAGNDVLFFGQFKLSTCSYMSGTPLRRCRKTGPFSDVTEHTSEHISVPVFQVAASSRLYPGSAAFYYKLMVSEQLAKARKSDTKGFVVPKMNDKKLKPLRKTPQLQFRTSLNCT